MKRRKQGFLRSFGIDRLWYCHSVRTITCYQVTVYERMKDGGELIQRCVVAELSGYS